jgi:hypothetical protein
MRRGAAVPTTVTQIAAASDMLRPLEPWKAYLRELHLRHFDARDLDVWHFDAGDLDVWHFDARDFHVRHVDARPDRGRVIVGRYRRGILRAVRGAGTRV